MMYYGRIWPVLELISILQGTVELYLPHDFEPVR